MDSIQIQKIVQKHFENTDEVLFLQIVDTFVYERGTQNSLVSKEIENFLKEMDLEDEYFKYISQRTASFFDRSNNEIFENIKIGMLNTSHNKFRNFIEKSSITNKEEGSSTIKKSDASLKNVKFLGEKLLKILYCLNSNETYIWSEHEDNELYNEVKEILKK